MDDNNENSKNKRLKTMNNYLDKVFDTPNKKAFIAFLTAGDPDADSTVKFILEMEKAGADLIEIGIPFSDPTAEGVVIQEANIRSLSSGMTTDGVFEIVKRVREQSEITLAGLPPTTVLGSTSFVTTAPPATTAFSPMVTPGIIQAHAPIHTLRSI